MYIDIQLLINVKGWLIKDFIVPALVTLVDIFSTVATHSWVGWYRCTAPWALQCLCRCLVVLIEV